MNIDVFHAATFLPLAMSKKRKGIKLNRKALEHKLELRKGSRSQPISGKNIYNRKRQGRGDYNEGM